ncbi:unnamed protein product (macronuclear) [Paramecium tetraurelia]|uniref:Uncharacterized protein n=1 Tax=Paramecium tetraurelia TaxID=5888 RepID=A0BLX1_PARTE|nr:uncharacterized protein GSPATT00030172001 [Paramecium tetraurelia]CAK59538.1 unnamed protein product [Paramecium tetraurelia]|eukprot:XP_001426936.1 hypothetical protein (macronuclear) [Paramecium tetraurelia strain d4-2]
MKQIIILALLLILVLGDQHHNRNNHQRHKKGHVFKWVLITLLSIGAFLVIRKIIRKRRQMKRMKKQGHNNLSDTVAFGEPTNDNVQQPQFYAVPIEQYEQYKNWMKQQKQQQEALLQQQQQQIQQQLLLQQQQAAQNTQIPQQPVAGYPIYQQYPQQMPTIVYPQLLSKSYVETQLPDVKGPQ